MDTGKAAIKTLKVLAAAAAVLLALVLLVLVLFLIRPVREKALDMALSSAGGLLPGRITLSDARWPAPGRIELYEAEWVDDGDTLAAAAEVRVSVDISSLLSRDVLVRGIVARGVSVDVPSITSRFPTSGESASLDEKEEKGYGGGFPRQGSLRGVPSVAADSMEIDVVRLVAADRVSFDGMRLSGSLDLLHGSYPTAVIEELSLDSSSVGVSVDSLWLTARFMEPSLRAGGTVGLPEGLGAALTCETGPDSTFSIRLVPAGGALSSTDTYVELEGRAHLEGRAVRSVDVDAGFRTPGTAELSSIPALAGALSRLGDLEGLEGAVEGRLYLSPSFSAQGHLETGGAGYLDTLSVSGAYSRDSIAVEELKVRMPGLSLDASGSLVRDIPALTLTVEIDSMTWLGLIMPDFSPPPDISADLAASSGAVRDDGAVPLRLTGNASFGKTALDSIDVSAVIPPGRDGLYTADLYLDATGMLFRTSAEADLSSGTRIELSKPGTAGPDSGTVYIAGLMSVDGESGSISVMDLHTEGMLGRLSVSAEMDSARNGTFELTGDWPEPPSVLSRFIEADSAAWDSLASVWRSDGPFEIRVIGSMSGNGDIVTASGSAHLPGPRALGTITGKEAAIGDLGPLELDLEGRWTAADSGSSAVATIDLGRTDWIDTALVSMTAAGEDLEVDTLRLSLEGLKLDARGSITGKDIGLLAGFSLADSLLVERLGRLAGRTVSLTLEGDCEISGSRSDPEIAAGMNGAFSTEGIVIPAFRASAGMAGDIRRAAVSMPEGLETRVVSFDSVNASYEDSPEMPAGDGASVRLRASGADSDFLLALRLPRGEHLTVLADTFHAMLAGQELDSKDPFSLSALEDGGFSIDGLFLEGNIGTIEAHGFFSPDSADLTADIDISLPPKPDFIQVAERLWPDTLAIDARVEGPGNISLNGHITGITLADEINALIDFEVTGGADRLKAALNVRGPDRSVCSVNGDLPPLHSLGSLSDGPLKLDIRFDRMPIPSQIKSVTADKPGTIGYMSGTIGARGTMSDPEAVIFLDCRFIGGNELEKYLLTIDGGYASRVTLSDTTLKRLKEGRNAAGTMAAIEQRTAGGISAGVTLAKSGEPVFTGVLEYPLGISLAPLGIERRESDKMLIDLSSRRIALNDLDPLLPPNLDLGGSVEMKFRAEGEQRNPAIEGSLKTYGMTVAVAKDFHGSPSVDLELGGTLEKPSIKGEVIMERALLTLPEMKENLLDTKGESILREAADSFRVASDTSLAAAVEDTLGGEKETRIPQMDIEVVVKIPNSFRIESERLNIELEGELHIRQQGGRPVVTGELKPTSGRLTFMGRYFQIQRGSVFFYGEDEMNPAFDLTLTARVAEFDITIKLTGTALEPEIELTSNPARSEGDIMSLLLFGQSMSDLDGSQSNLLQERTAQILMIYGASKLEGEMKSRLGVDMFTFEASTRDPNKTSLTVGKYINTRTMLKYEQGVEDTANFLINLEYQLTRKFTIETFIDQNSETGLEINWSTEY